MDLIAIVSYFFYVTIQNILDRNYKKNEGNENKKKLITSLQIKNQTFESVLLDNFHLILMDIVAHMPVHTLK